MIEASHLRLLVIRPTLEHLGLWSLNAENLLLGTAAQESKMGHFLKQVGGGGVITGPAVGLYQMEPWVHDDLWNNFLKFQQDLAEKVMELLAFAGGKHDQLIWNLGYSTAIARCQYRRFPTALPAAADVPGLAAYWKKHWNTELGKGTVDQFIKSYTDFVL